MVLPSNGQFIGQPVAVSSSLSQSLVKASHDDPRGPSGCQIVNN